ncbi:MAG: OB-fold nucleic acid binding domain-containing protein, partial [Desulfobulbaceae bacterium]|nr:OB-fold nucleic acid binding domain-containing protein [Desulfobulbaceae bacterium]
MNELNQVLKQRRQKADELAATGVNLYGNSFRPTHRVADILPLGAGITVDSNPGSQPVTVAGRILALRKFGKASFLHLQDESGKIQIYVQRDS